MPHLAPRADSFTTSLFCQRLKQLANEPAASTSLKNLCTATERLVDSAEAISSRVIEHLPQFTLHDGTHLWNVLSFMEELAGGREAIAKLNAGDCAMAVWACFIHDLGMVLEATELAALDADDHYDTSPTAQGKPSTWSGQRGQDWRAYRDGHEHWNYIRAEPHGAKSRMKLGIIRAAFIRDSHARHDNYSGHCRIADWLAFMAQGDRLIAQAIEDFSLDERIVRVAVSHNQDIAWLPRQLSALSCSDPDAEHDAELGIVHWTWIGWLLRLADVFDCDASRTPRILFDHSGITDHRSRTEWQKHLAIRNAPTWKAGNDNQSLIYTCHLSPSPIVEKAIHQIIGWMNDEITKCRAAWNALSPRQRSGIELALPSEVRPDIKKRADDYLYQDIEFRLDRDAVVELLMGESLYGGPELALRELVQNALDAVHLRDQRNKLAIALEKAGNQERARQPHEPWGATSGEVHVTWGTETDGQKRSWIKVQDNGVGMTVATMRRFLTQIGKSYYKSNDFHAEQELMRRHGILCTAISQFGIGFLSVFMLADHVEIHTRPVGGEDNPDRTKPNWQDNERFPFRADIHGPHGLIAFYPDDVKTTGTTVKLWLKKKFVLPSWNRELVIAKLKQNLYEIQSPILSKIAYIPNRQLCDPPFEIGRFILWPLYPVRMGEPESAIVLDHQFHIRELVPFDRAGLQKKQEEWGESISEAGTADWQACDWIDSNPGPNGVVGTGSRIRLIAPSATGNPAQPLSPSDWSVTGDYLPTGAPRMTLYAMTEPQLPAPRCRYQCLVNGVRVVPGFVAAIDSQDSRLSQVMRQLPLANGLAGWAWIDLRGVAMPQLRADRSAPTRSQSVDWDLMPVLDRWSRAFPPRLPSWVEIVANTPVLRYYINMGDSQLRRLGMLGLQPRLLSQFALLEQSTHHFSHDAGSAFLARDPQLAAVIKRSLQQRDPDFRATRRLVSNHFHEVAFMLFMARRLAKDLPDQDAKNFTGQLSATLEQRAPDELRVAYPLEIEMRRLVDPELSVALSLPTSRSLLFASWVNLHLASEMLWPSFAMSHPAMGWRGMPGKLADYQLTGPLHAALTTIVTNPEWLDGYDLIAPFTAFALPRLGKAFGDWMTDRKVRAVLTLPFLAGIEPMHWRTILKCHGSVHKLMLFMPNPANYEWLFTEHTRKEWNQGSASALWDLETGQVLYADGIHTEQSLRSEGKPLREWLALKD